MNLLCEMVGRNERDERTQRAEWSVRRGRTRYTVRVCAPIVSTWHRCDGVLPGGVCDTEMLCTIRPCVYTRYELRDDEVLSYVGVYNWRFV